jgi:hypothetical protein
MDCWNPNRQRIYDWMVANDLKSFAELYKGAVINLCEKNPGHVRFVSHAVRDLMNGMAARKLGRKRKQVDYNRLVEDLLISWKNHHLPRSADSFESAKIEIEPPANVPIAEPVLTKIQVLLREHEDGMTRGKENLNLFLQAFWPNPAAGASLPEAHVQMWKKLHAWFRAHCHENGEPLPNDISQTMEKKFEQLESIFLSAADRYLNTISTLDEILDRANN